jgi:hypothetical protein
MVRMPERAITRAKRTVCYLVGGPRDEASAAAARVAVESGVLGDEWIFGADGTAGEASHPHEAVMAIVRSADIGSEGAVALESFVARAERLGPASLVLFVPPVGDADVVAAAVPEWPWGIVPTWVVAQPNVA